MSPATVSPPGRQRIAIVGAGISGLTAAYLLHRAHEITVFEANDYAGGHTNTITLERPHGRYAVDTGFIVFNEHTYPNFVRLLRALAVASQPSTMSFSVRDERSGEEYRASSLNTFFAQRRNLFKPKFYRLLADILRFRREAGELLQDTACTVALGEYLHTRRYSPFFVSHFILPMGAAIWSAPADHMLKFPARFFVQFFINHGFLQRDGQPQWRVIRGGSQRYVEPLTAPFRARLHLRTPVTAVRRRADRVVVTTAAGAHSFDAVIIATHSDQALAMVADPTPQEQALLSQFPYQANTAVLHTDINCLPRTRRAWASWNYHLGAGDAAAVTVSYNMNILQSLASPETFIVTLNSPAALAPEAVLAQVQYQHPVFTRSNVPLQAQHDALNGVRRTYYCGAYWRYGFHEDGVVSALTVCRHFGVALP